MLHLFPLLFRFLSFCTNVMLMVFRFDNIDLYFEDIFHFELHLKLIINYISCYSQIQCVEVSDAN